MIELVASFQNQIDGPTRTASIYWSQDDQQYIVRMRNDMGHDFQSRFAKQELERAKDCAREWVKDDL